MKIRMNLKIIAITVVAALLALSMTSCGGKSADISNLMTEFEYSCNTLDLDAMLDCINPQIANKAKLAMGAAGMFAQQDTDETLEKIADLITGNSVVNAKDFFSSVKITTEDIKTKGDYGSANAILEYDVAGEHYKTEAYFEYINAMDKWYISNFRLK